MEHPAIYNERPDTDMMYRDALNKQWQQEDELLPVIEDYEREMYWNDPVIVSGTELPNTILAETSKTAI